MNERPVEIQRIRASIEADNKRFEAAEKEGREMPFHETTIDETVIYTKWLTKRVKEILADQ